MAIVPSCLHASNRKNNPSPVKSRRWDRAPRWVQDRVSSQSLKTYLLIQRLTNGKPRRLPKRLLASHRGVSTKTIFNHICELIDAKVLRAVYAKIGPRRNAPNLYVLLDIDGGDLHLTQEKNCTEKLVQTLKPKATPREARVVNHHPAMRKLYEHNARLFRQLREARNSKRSAYRLQAAKERTRRAMAASVGVYTGPKSEISEDWIREFHARQKAFRDAGASKMEVSHA